MNNDVTTASPEQIERMREMLDSFKAFLLNYEFGIDEILTKINVLRSEYETIKDSSPIEHVSSRLKTPESIIGKMQRKGGPITLAGIRETVRDIAGVRVVCAFIEDTYRVAEAFTRQPDITVVEVKDYIKNPKPNGYKSLHLIVEVPVFLSTGPVSVPVEVQIRTIDRRCRGAIPARSRGRGGVRSGPHRRRRLRLAEPGIDRSCGCSWLAHRGRDARAVR